MAASELRHAHRRVGGADLCRVVLRAVGALRRRLRRTQRSRRSCSVTRPGSGASGGNGVFAYGSGSFPSGSYQGSNYWVDVVFVDSSGPVVSSRFPASGSTGVALTTIVTASFNEAIQAGSATIELRDSQGAIVGGSTSYDSSTRTLTLTPAGSLVSGSGYTASVSGARDMSGNEMSGTTSWSFTTSSVSTLNLFGQVTPPTPSANDTAAVELGMRFRSSVSGKVHGVRFYKGPANAGAHVGHLWTAAGVLISTAVFGAETSSGWQFASFDAPVSITANTDYVVSYYAPKGGYSVAASYFATGDIVKGPLTGIKASAATPNGVYRYGSGGGFPVNSSKATNYWVDVAFEGECDRLARLVGGWDGAAGVPDVAGPDVAGQR